MSIRILQYFLTHTFSLSFFPSPVQAKVSLSSAEIRDLVKQLDLDGDGEIDYRYMLISASCGGHLSEFLMYIGMVRTHFCVRKASNAKSSRKMS